MSKKIREFEENDKVFGSYLVTNVVKGVTANSRNYMTITLQDDSGSIEGKKWDSYKEDEEVFAIGNVVSINADVILYKTSLQLKIYNGEVVPMNLVDISRFLIMAPESLESLTSQINEYVSSFKNKDLKLITETLLKKHWKAYTEYPAATKFHHAFGRGLMYHSVSMARLAEKVCSCYPVIQRDLLIAGALLHDLGKTEELSGPIAPHYTTEGRLLGHINILAGEIQEEAKKLNIDPEVGYLLEHLVLSHHGKPEFGSAVQPMIREAFVLNMIDDLDAKMNVLDKAFDGVKKGEWTQKIFPLDDRSFYLPVYDEKK